MGTSPQLPSTELPSTELPEETLPTRADTRQLTTPIGRGVPVENFDQLWRMATALAEARDMRPRSLDTPAKCLVVMQTGLEVGLTPFQSVRSLYVVNGMPQWYARAAIGLVQASDTLKAGTRIDTWLEDAEGARISNPPATKQEYVDKGIVAVCRTHRKGEPEPVSTRFGVNDAQLAGLWRKDGPWQNYPARMLMARARGFHLQDYFGDVLAGFTISDYASPEEAPREEIDVTPALPPAPPEGEDPATAALLGDHRSVDPDQPDDGEIVDPEKPEPEQPPKGRKRAKKTENPPAADEGQHGAAAPTTRAGSAPEGSEDDEPPPPGDEDAPQGSEPADPAPDPTPETQETAELYDECLARAERFGYGPEDTKLLADEILEDIRGRKLEGKAAQRAIRNWTRK